MSKGRNIRICETLKLSETLYYNGVKVKRKDFI